jgi:hypothetical protein
LFVAAAKLFTAGSGDKFRYAVLADYE